MNPIWWLMRFGACCQDGEAPSSAPQRRAAIGVAAAGKIPEKAYRVFVMAMTGVAGVLLFVL